MLEDLSIGKILLILVVVVIFFGPKKIPDLAQSLGKGIREFKKAMRDVTDEVQNAADDKPKPPAALPPTTENSGSPTRPDVRSNP